MFIMQPLNKVVARIYHMWLSEQNPDMFAHKLKFILLPRLH